MASANTEKDASTPSLINDTSAEIVPETRHDTQLGASNPCGNVPLFDASKMAFNDRAWNDPPPQLMSSLGSNVQKPSTRKLNSRVAFPLDSTQYPASASTTFNIMLDPNAPPPVGGFVNCSSQDSSKPNAQ